MKQTAHGQKLHNAPFYEAFIEAQSLDSTASVDAGESSTPEEDEPTNRYIELLYRVPILWKEAYLGLCRIRNNRGPTHVSRLLELYAGAGMSAHLLLHNGKNTSAIHHDLGLLGIALEQNELQSLVLYHGLPDSLLESVIKILEAYKREADNLTELYGILWNLQIDLREPTLKDEILVREQFSPAAESLARRLLHLDAKLKILQSEMSDWNWEERGGRPGDFWYIEQDAFIETV